MCWKHKLVLASEGGKLTDELKLQAELKLADELKGQWLHNAIGAVPNQQTGDFLKLLDRIWSLNPLYFYLWKERALVPTLHQLFERWVQQYVEPEKCMQLLYDRYVLKVLTDAPDDWRSKARQKFKHDTKRPGLVSCSQHHRDPSRRDRHY